MAKDFTKTLYEASVKINGLPKAAVMILPEIESALSSFGLLRSYTSKAASDLDSQADAEVEKFFIENENENIEYATLIPKVLGRVASLVLLPTLNSMMSFGAKGLFQAGLAMLRSQFFLVSRVAISVITTATQLMIQAIRLSIMSVARAVSFLLHNPIALGATAAAALATAVIAYHRYSKLSADEKHSLISKAKSFFNFDVDLPKEYFYIDDSKKVQNYSNISADAVSAAVSVNNIDLSLVSDNYVPEFTEQTEIIETMKKEGWDKIDNSSSKNYSKFGINFSKNRSKDFIKNLTAEQAYDIYKKEYWDASGVEKLPSHLRRMYFNTAVNMGVSKAKKLYNESDGTLEGFATARWNEYTRLAQENPVEYGKYLKGWRSRLIKEYNESIQSLKSNLHNASNNFSSSTAPVKASSEKQYIALNKSLIAY